MIDDTATFAAFWEHMCLVFIMDLKVQLDSASLELIKCQIILENNTAKNIMYIRLKLVEN